MKFLETIRLLLSKFFDSASFVETPNDSHQWENKMEMLRELSSHRTSF